MTWSHFLPAFGGLFVIVMLRANATYWIGRGAAAGTRRWRSGDGGDARTAAHVERARRLINRWGPIAVVFCFLTVGIQTAVNATAGVTRMPLRRYLPAVTLGSILWATLYATVGLAAAKAWLAAAARSPLAATLIALVLVAALVGLVVHRRARRRRGGAGTREDGGPHGSGDVQDRVADMRS